MSSKYSGFEQAESRARSPRARDRMRMPVGVPPAASVLQRRLDGPPEPGKARRATDRLTLETPEHVALELPVAGIGHRALAWLLDAGILFLFWVTLILAFFVAVGPLGPWLAGLATAAQVV